jgi:hypothetical protein
MNPFFIGLPALLISLLIAYVLRERSLRNLDTIQAGTLVLVLRPKRIRFVLIAAGMVATFLVLRFSLPRFTKEFFLAFICLFTATTLFAQWIAWQSLRKENFPPGFTGLYGAAQIFDCIGYVALFGAMVATQFIDLKG